MDPIKVRRIQTPFRSVSNGGPPSGITFRLSPGMHQFHVLIPRLLVRAGEPVNPPAFWNPFSHTALDVILRWNRAGDFRKLSLVFLSESIGYDNGHRASPKRWKMGCRENPAIEEIFVNTTASRSPKRKNSPMLTHAASYYSDTFGERYLILTKGIVRGSHKSSTR